jgi:hypothetical protein
MSILSGWDMRVNIVSDKNRLTFKAKDFIVESRRGSIIPLNPPLSMSIPIVSFIRPELISVEEIVKFIHDNIFPFKIIAGPYSDIENCGVIYIAKSFIVIEGAYRYKKDIEPFYLDNIEAGIEGIRI